MTSTTSKTSNTSKTASGTLPLTSPAYVTALTQPGRTSMLAISMQRQYIAVAYVRSTPTADQPNNYTIIWTALIAAEKGQRNAAIAYVQLHEWIEAIPQMVYVDWNNTLGVIGFCDGGSAQEINTMAAEAYMRYRMKGTPYIKLVYGAVYDIDRSLAIECSVADAYERLQSHGLRDTLDGQRARAAWIAILMLNQRNQSARTTSFFPSGDRLGLYIPLCEQQYKGITVDTCIGPPLA